jgi:hypothetical protein
VANADGSKRGQCWIVANKNHDETNGGGPTKPMMMPMKWQIMADKTHDEANGRSWPTPIVVKDAKTRLMADRVRLSP